MKVTVQEKSNDENLGEALVGEIPAGTLFAHDGYLFVRKHGPCFAVPFARDPRMKVSKVNCELGATCYINTNTRVEVIRSNIITARSLRRKR